VAGSLTVPPVLAVPAAAGNAALAAAAVAVLAAVLVAPPAVALLAPGAPGSVPRGGAISLFAAARQLLNWGFQRV
jgi:hypothetical protein